MRYKKLFTVALIVLLSVASFKAEPQEDYSSGAIKTAAGYLLVWNEKNNHYMLEIKGKNVRQSSTERIFFNVDGMFLQINTAHTDNFLKDANKKKLDDKTILATHRDWEAKYMEGEYKEKLKVESSWQKLDNGKDALLWQIDVPPSARGNVKKQIYLTVMKGDYVLMLGGVETDKVEESATKELLLNTVATLKVSDKPIDLRKLQEAIRKEASR
jgi:hydrogenase maturation factor